MNSKKLTIPLLIALVGFPQISETIYTPSLPAVANGLGASAHAIEATLAIYFIGFALGVTLWGAVSDFLGRRTVMIIGLLIYGFSTINCALATSVEELLVWRCLQAFGASVGSVITQTMLRDAFDHTQRAKLFSLIGGALAFSPAIGPLMGGYISELWGWKANFWTLVLDRSRHSYLGPLSVYPKPAQSTSASRIYLKLKDSSVICSHPQRCGDISF